MGDFFSNILTTLIGAGGVAAVLGALLKSWFTLQLEKHQKEQAERLEAIKSELSLIIRLRGSAEERRAEVAATTLIVCLQFLDRLRANTSPGHFGEPGLDSFQKEVIARWQASREISTEFSKQWVLAETYLSPAVGDLLDRAWKLCNEIQVDQGMHFDVSSHSGPRDRSFWKAGFGDETRAKIAGLREEAKALLRPIAQLSQENPSGNLGGLPNRALNATGAGAPAR